MRDGNAAIHHLEAALGDASWAEGLLLRYGWCYGPGTSIALDPPGSQIALLRERQFPIVGRGTGVWSFIHVEDAATATVAAVEGGAAGTYNIVDDEPATAAEFLPVLAAAVGAKRPLRVPRWLGRLAAGDMAVMAMNELRGAANDKAERELGWDLRFPSWRRGFVDGLRDGRRLRPPATAGGPALRSAGRPSGRPRRGRGPGAWPGRSPRWAARG